MSVFVDFKPYIPSDIDTDMLLSEVPLDILQDNIEDQFKDPFGRNRKMDYLSTYISQYEYTLSVCKESEDEDDNDRLDSMHTRFISFMNGVFDKYLDIAFPELGDMDVDSQNEMLQFTYRYFILNIKHNFENLIINYIKEHKEEICNEIGKEENNSISSNYKKEITDPSDIIILSNLNLVLTYILSREYTIEEFMNLSEGDEPTLEKYLLEDYYDKNLVVGNFLEKYFKMLKKPFMIELESSVRNLILRKYIKYI